MAPELQFVVSCLVGAGMEPRPFARVVSALKPSLCSPWKSDFNTQGEVSLCGWVVASYGEACPPFRQAAGSTVHPSGRHQVAPWSFMEGRT